MVAEQELVQRILNGDVRAFELLVNEYQKLAYHVVCRLTGNNEDIEDICQEVFMKVHKNLKKFRFQSKLSTWIASIAYLTAINYLKKYRKQGVKELKESSEDFYFSEAKTENILERKNEAAYINNLIQQMPLTYRTVLTLYHLNEFSIAEIHEITKMPEGTIKSHLSRGRQLLKEKLESNEGAGII